MDEIREKMDELWANEMMEIYVHQGQILKWEKKGRWMGYISLGVSNFFLHPLIVIKMDDCPASYNFIEDLKIKTAKNGKRLQWVMDCQREKEENWLMDSLNETLAWGMDFVPIPSKINDWV